MRNRERSTRLPCDFIALTESRVSAPDECLKRPLYELFAAYYPGRLCITWLVQVAEVGLF